MSQSFKDQLVDFCKSTLDELLEQEKDMVKLSLIGIMASVLDGAATACANTARLCKVTYSRRADIIDAPFVKPEPEPVNSKTAN